ERERHVMRAVLLVHCRQREQVRLDCQRVSVSDPGEARIRKHRKIVRPFGADTLAQCTLELRVGPAADSGFRIGRNVRAIKRPEWCLQCSASGEFLPAWGGVTRKAAATRYSPRSTVSSSAAAAASAVSSNASVAATHGII